MPMLTSRILRFSLPATSSTRPDSPLRLHRLLTFGWLFLLLAFVAGSAIPAHAVSTVHLVLRASSGDELAQLAIGQDLFASIENAAPGTDYRIDWVDDTGVLVRRTEVTTPAAAGSEPTRVELWRFTGVYGCDDGVTLDPRRHQYATLEEAAKALDGRLFSARLFDASGRLLDEAFLPLVVDPTAAVFFGYDEATGCPSYTVDEGEDMIMAGKFLQAHQGPVTIFLVEHDRDRAPGDRLDEVRGQVQTSWIDGAEWVEVVWPALEVRQGGYDVVIRLGTDPTPVLEEGDVKFAFHDHPNKVPETAWPMPPTEPDSGSGESGESEPEPGSGS